VKVYNELYAAWQREVTESSLGALPPDFYAKIAEYLKRIKEENKPQDKKSVKVNLLEHEEKNVSRMLEELLWERYKKIIKTTTKLQKVPTELLTIEETKMCNSFADFSDAYQTFSKKLMQGSISELPQTEQPIRVTIRTEAAKTETPAQVPTPAAPKRLTLRFSKSIPAIMGADMKSYGPFAVEDVASLPELNAKILVKQGLAVLVEAT
jgi:DNA replication initiation complex subunit (GINS family)